MKQIVRNLSYLILIIFTLFNIIEILMNIDGMIGSAGDFGARWRECAYIVKGIYPFDIIKGNKKIIEEIGDISEIAGTVPWAYLLGNTLVPGFVEINRAKTYFNIISILIYIFTIVKTKKITNNSLIVTILCFVSMWAFATSLIRGNYGSVCGCFVILSIAYYKENKIISGILLTLASLKPQISGLFFVTYLMMGEWIIVFISSCLILLFWIICSIITNTNIIMMIKDILFQGIGYNQIENNHGIFTFFRSFGISNKTIMILSAILGITLTIIFTMKINDKWKFVPAILLTPSWFYLHSYDYQIMFLVVLFITEIILLETKNRYMLIDLFVIVDLTGGYLVWQKMMYFISIHLISCPDIIIRDVMLFIECISYILVCIYLINKGKNLETK